MNKKCRYCNAILEKPFLDLGMQPLSNDYLSEERIAKGQHYLPLRVCACRNCGLIQIADYEAPEIIFNEEYKYYSSYSLSWLEHCKQYVKMICERLSLSKDSQVFEVASNDGYLLQYFLQRGLHPVGIEPSISTARIAVEKGIENIPEFFGTDLAMRLVREGRVADLIIANNVLAHVPDIGDFVHGLKILLKPTGTITIESPHFLNILKYHQFDTIYHEHFSYITLLAMKRIFEDNGLKIYDVEQLHTHGGSIRIYVAHKENMEISVLGSVKDLFEEEQEYKIYLNSKYESFSGDVREKKREILQTLIDIKSAGKTVVGYGAAAKGNTMFNYCGIGTEFIDYVVDANPNKQGLFLPGSLIPIYEPSRIRQTKPDYVLVIPWNLREEIQRQLSFITEWGGKFLVFIPEVEEFVYT